MGMEQSDVLIIGGSAGGPITGISARRSYPNKKITIVRKEEQVLVPCGIPYIFGTVGSPEKNLIPYDDVVLPKYDIDVVIDEVIDIDKDAKKVKTLKGTEIGYEKLVIATGSLPIVPPIPGADLDNVFFAEKDVDYLNGVLNALKGVKDMVIIGGGFIGVEFADELRKKGLNVTIIEMLPHCLQLAFDEEFSLKAEEKLKEAGIDILTETSAKEILGVDGKVKSVKLSDGKEINADAVLLGIGARPNVELAQKIGLKMGEMKAIAVDEYMRTSEEDIFAVGDCAEKKSFFTEKPSGLRLASIAGTEARIAGANIFELKMKNEGVIGSFSTIIGDLAFGVAGLTEKAAKDARIDFVKAEGITFDKHPGSMPNTSKMYLKLLFSKTGEIIGGGVYGGSTTAEFINIIASMIQKKVNIEDVVKFQMTTHPALTASPVLYLIADVAEMAMVNLQ